MTIDCAIVSVGAVLCLCFSAILIGLTVRNKAESDKFLYRLGQFLGLSSVLSVYAILLAYAIAVILSFSCMNDCFLHGFCDRFNSPR
ncbi:MAG: hypothetical protein J7647_29615 [Cyanobacteria bacterium SBLK]|nr:hypothetical protein [Cyanobacteria bacterium SBLK]